MRNTVQAERVAAVMWMFDAGDGLERSRALLAEAERARAWRPCGATTPHSGSGRRRGIRRRMGLALIRRGEALAGISNDPALRFS